MKKIKQRIAKLLRLSLSNSPHEAQLASLKVVELMEKYALSRADLISEKIVVKEILQEYYTIPRWVRSLYSDIAHINGCYVVWYQGSAYAHQKARIVITGLQSDVENINYYVEVIKKEIFQKAERFKQEVSSKRQMVNHYRLGLSEGVFSFLYTASKSFNSSIKSNALVSIDSRYSDAREHYLRNVDCVNEKEYSIINSLFYSMGRNDAQNINISRPVDHKSVEPYNALEYHNGK